MNNPFQLNYTQYKQQFSSLPVDDMIQVGEAWNQQYQQGVQQADQLKDQILAIDVTDQDAQEKNRLVEGALTQIDQFAEKGNFEDAPFAAMKIARELKDNQWLKNAMSRYQGIQTNLKELRDNDASDAQMYGFQKHLEKYGVTPTQKNKFGEYDRYMQFDAFKEPDIRKMVQDELDSLKAQKSSEIVEDGQKMYIINNEKLSEKDLFDMAKATVLNDPKASKLIQWETEMNFNRLNPEQKKKYVQMALDREKARVQNDSGKLSQVPKIGPAAIEMKESALKKREAAVPAIEKAAQAHGVDPNILDFIAYQESRYTPEAMSPVGAQGMFQFMPDTAKQYGVDPWNPESAADGAARYVKDLLNMYEGDTEKALAAYNWGMGRVNKLVARARKEGVHWKDLLTVAETKGYLESWNKWNSPSPEYQQAYKQHEDKTKASLQAIKQMEQMTATPEGLDKATMEFLRESLLKEKFGPIASSRAIDNETITNLRVIKPAKTSSTSSEGGKGSDSPYSAYTASSFNAAAKASEKGLDPDSNWKLGWESFKETDTPAWMSAVSLPLKAAAIIKEMRQIYSDKKEDRQKQIQKVEDYTQKFAEAVKSGAFKEFEEISKAHGVPLADLSKVDVKQAVNDAVRNNELRPSPVLRMGAEMKLLGKQEDERGVPLQGDRTFFISGDRTDGGGDLTNTKGITEVYKRVAKRVDVNVDDVEFYWEKQGISAANPQGIPGAIVYTLRMVDKNTKELISETDVFASNANSAVANRFQPLQQMAEFAYSGAIGFQNFGDDIRVVNILSQTPRGYQAVPYVQLGSGKIMSFDSYVELEAKTAFNLNNQK